MNVKLRHPDWTEEQTAVEAEALVPEFNVCQAVKEQIRFIRELAQYVVEHPE